MAIATFVDDFLQEELDWWDEEPELPPLERPPPRPRPTRRRPPPRTLAGDLARLRAWAAERTSLPPAVVGLAALALVLGAAAGLRTLLSDTPVPPPDATAGPAGSPAAQPAVAQPEATPAAPVRRAARLLESGDAGPAVYDLQAALAALGYLEGRPDGAYGPGTAAAVASFQAARGLTADGVAGAQTSAALVEAVAEAAAADAVEVERGLAAAGGGGTLPAADVEAHRAVLAEALEAIRRLPPGGSATVGRVLGVVAGHADGYGPTQALALFGTLAANVRHLSESRLSAETGGMTDEHGLVYRHFAAHGFQLHPLASFARLNAVAGRGEREPARRLAAALAARGVSRGAGTVWEYHFPFGGPTRWTSGMAQAVGAQALARAGGLLGDPALTELAGRAFRAIPQGLTIALPEGTWIREYGFADTAILNAHLQAIVSLAEYVELTGDEQARVLVDDMSAAARTLLPRFDNGCWSRYALDGSPASLHYHTYHRQLLRRLAQTTGDPTWRETANRWTAYARAGGCA